MKELKNLRKIREKHFLNDDGTITAYVYNEDIHYLDNGEYKEIDNTLIEEDKYITNKSNNFKIRLNKNKYSVNIDLDNNNYLNMSLKDSNDVSAKILNNEVIYENILPNIDIHYLLHGKSLKENIYLKSKINTNIVFNIDTNLKLELKDNKVLVMDNEEVIYTFNPLFMVDVKDNVSNNCNYKLIKIGEKYELELILDQEYLNNAKYPVIVDPTITSENLENVFDVTIDSNEPTRNHNNLKYIYVGRNENGIMRGLLKFDLPNIQTGSNIIKATAYLKNMERYESENPRKISVHEITTTWNELTATWENMNNNYNKTVETYLTSPQIGESDVLFEFNVTNIVKKWYTDKANNGIMFKWADESETEQRSYCFYSKTYDAMYGSANRPVLVIEYRLQNGLLDYMTYESIPLSCGASYINKNNGNLITQISASEILDPTSLYNLQLTYSTHNKLLNEDNKFGYGFNISYNDHVLKTTNQFMGVEYLYNLSDGSSHYFYRDSENVFHDEDGLSLTLEVVNETTKEYNIVDVYGNIYKFVNSYLTKIEYVDKTFVNLTRDSSNNITSIKDSKNNEVTFSYNVNQVILTCNNKSITINLSDNLINNISTKKGNIIFNYNNNSLISKITDINGLSVAFVYYEVSPYRIKKITEYGLEGAAGSSKTFTYEFKSTTITDNKNNKMRYTFNNIGNTISTVLLDEDESLKSAYGFANKYVNEPNSVATNKVLASSLPIMYNDNLIKNGSFETTESNFLSSYRSNEDSYTGEYSAKIVSGATGEIRNIWKSEKNYTFSAYFKNEKPIDVQIYGTRATGLDILEEYTIMPSEEFTKYEKTFGLYMQYACVGFIFSVRDSGIAYIDDVVINEGDAAGFYNLIDNSDFQNNADGWQISGHIDGVDEEISNPYQIITLPSNELAIQLNSIVNGGISMIKTLNLSGKVGDVYTFSFWYKNEGVFNVDTGMVGNMVSVIFNNPNDEFGSGTQNVLLNYHADNWQYFTDTCVAEDDYDSITIMILSMYEANNISLTNFSLVKDLGSYSFKYDENGNLISLADTLSNKSEFKYDSNNQLISSFNAKGNNFKYEYDNAKPDRLLKGISPTGISNEIKYDDFGNPIATIINNVNPKNNDLSGNFYIRSKGTDKYLTPNLETGEISLKNDTCSHYAYAIVSHIEINDQTETKVYNLKSTILPNNTLTAIDNTFKLIRGGTCTNFELISQDNGSKLIKIYNEDLYLKVTDEGLVFASLEDNSSFEFYFEDIDTNEFIKNTAKYTEDGKYITKMIDTLGNTTTYDIDSDTGLVNSITNAKGIETTYTYDNKDQLTSVEVDNKQVEYTYENDLIKNIQTGNKNYQFEYDAFLKPTKVKINNQLLISNEYEENNGKLKKVTYGNNAIINYEYDKFGRLSKVNNYEYHYNNSGLLKRVDDLSLYMEDYTYDFANRIKTYVYNEKFKINYNYDINSNINHKDYYYANYKNTLDYIFNEDDSVIKVNFNNNSVNYNYDYLGRLTSKNINNKLPVEFTYKKNGNKTSLIIDTIKIDNNIYKYLYDNLYNITSILKNNEIINEYTYDNRSQLLTDSNYELNKKYVYTYDNEGNILTKKEYNLETNELIKSDTFTYGNSSWEDQLTKFNNEAITYDAIGNPITIGSKVLTWSKGRQLTKYKDGNTEINYKYNKDGIRVSKEIGDNETNYYLEGTKIIFEERNNNVIYYIYDDGGDLLGFIYNNELYYYQKNYQNDITGIYDSNYNLVVTYTYDAWGKVISVSDTTTTNIGIINPFRYRSYYYDEETKLYYLNSRYYNPEWCRFINADGVIGANQDILSLNLYAYVSNNPVNNSDSSGNFIGKIIRKGLQKVAKAALKEIGKVAVKTVKKLVTDKITGWYQIGKAYVDSKINDAKLHYTEISISKPTENLSATVGGKSVSIRTSDTRKVHEFEGSCSTDRVYSLGIISYTKSSNYDCLDATKTEISSTSSGEISFRLVSISSEGVFVGESANINFFGYEIDAKAGYYFKWDYIINGS